jgi:secreted PhoX family phosphatase
MYLTELTQDAAGKLTPVSTRPIDFAGVHGLERPCAGSVSPWNTHLGSEEADPDARKWENDVATLGDSGVLGKDDIYTYWGLPATPTVAQAKAVYNPYHYGYVVEVAVDETGKTTVSKHYSSGRRGLELSYVMPDQRTVYLSDDSANATFYMFVAQRAGDLSEGQLYGLRWIQTSPRGAAHGSAEITWTPLGPSATDGQVKKLIDDGTRFSDIFEYAAPTGTTCPADFKFVNADYRPECLKLKNGMELAASRLETKRYAGYVDGVTSEFAKTEGITFDAAASRLYLSVSDIGGGMVDAADGSKNHIRLAQNKCGMVLEFVIAHNSAIGSDYVAESASSLVEGLWLNNPDLAYPTDSPYFDPAATKPGGSGDVSIVTNVCSISGIASPDNLTFLPGYDTLLIGEDATEGHQNDIVWAFNIVSHELTRILSTPYGAETTGVYFYPNLGGHAYIKTQVQHPYGESDSPLAPDADARQGYSGYIGPLPPMGK